MNRLLLLSAAVLLTACGSGETDKIGRASTVFNMLGKNDRIEVGRIRRSRRSRGCLLYFVCKKRRLEGNGQFGRGRVRRIGFVRSDGIFDFFDETAVRKPKEVFKHGASFAFKSKQIVRYYDPKRKTSAYLVYSDKIIQGSPKNSLSAVSCFGGGIPQTDGVQADTSGKLFASTCMISNPIENPDKR